MAPIALAAVALGVYLIVHSTLVHHDSAATSTTTTRTTENRPQQHHHGHLPVFYIVRSGDTLSSIAARAGVPLAQLTALNPSVAPPSYNLQTGQRLRLRR